jgi:uncharacterized RDD family membrane protein YckC
MPAMEAIIGKLDTIRRIELPEGIDIRLRPAGPFRRAGAMALDFLILIGMAIVAGILAMMLGSVIGPEVAVGLYMIFLFLIMWFYFAWFEVKRGGTPGKRAVGLKVVQTNGNPITWRQGIVRSFLLWADFLPAFFILGLLFCSFTKAFQRLGDLAAGTVVVHSREYNSVFAPSNTFMPPPPLPLTVPLDREEQQALLAFLDRAPSWSPPRQEEMISHLTPLTGEGGSAGVRKALGMAAWLRHDPRQK